MEKMDLFKLKKDQQSAFNKLKKALVECKKSGIFFYNNYGHLGAVNGEFVSGYTDEMKAFSIPDNNQNITNEVIIANEWADDKHYFQPTEKYKKLIESEGLKNAVEGF